MFFAPRYSLYIVVAAIGLLFYLILEEGWFSTAHSRYAKQNVVLSTSDTSPIPTSIGCTVAPDFPLRIMPVGDSITYGKTASDETGYRRFLFDRLVADCEPRLVRYIGSQHSGLTEPPGRNAMDESEGYGGFDIPHMLDTSQTNLPATLARKPNVVLLHIGTNDMSPMRAASEDPPTLAPRNLEVLIDRLLKHGPNVTLILAQIISSPNPGWNQSTAIYNAAMPEIVERKVAAGYKVLLVDMSPVGSDCVRYIDGSGVDCPDLLDDGLHPKDEGFRKMAEIWFAGLQKATAMGLITASTVHSGHD